jgi:subtilase family serine protease
MTGRAVLAALVTVLFAGPVLSRAASATTVVPIAADDLAREADAIVVGTVTAINSAWRPTEDRIVTYVTLSVDEVLKGAPRTHLTIRQAGGTIGDFEAWIVGSPEFEVGERVVLFLHRNDDGTARVAHLYQGKFSLVVDPASSAEHAVRDLRPPGVRVLPGWFGPRAPVPDFHEITDLRARVLAAVSQAARAGQHGRSIVDAHIAEETVSQANFTYLGSPSRWFEPDTGAPVRMLMDQTGEPGTQGRAFDAVRAAYGAWSNVPGSSFRYEDTGLTATRGFRQDSQNVVTFGDPFNEISPPSGCSGTVAYGGFFRLTASQKIVNGTLFIRIIEGDVVIADGWNGCGFYEIFNNFAEVVAHELGHVLGLGHSSGDSIMAPIAHWDGRGARLSADDVAAMQFIYPAVGPDLAVTAVGNPPASTAVGASFTASDTVTNQGTSGAGSSTTRYYLSLNTQWDTGDARMTGSRPVGDVTAGSISSGTASVTVPSIATGTYYLIACADDAGQVSESNEGNNCRAAATTVQVAGTPPPPPPAGGADLVVTEIANPPSSASAGGTFGARDWLLNQGTAAAGAFVTRFYLSLDGVRDSADTLLIGSRSIPGLSPGATSKGTVTVLIPGGTPSGLYVLIACTDDLNQVGESNEANNCRASQTRIQIGTGSSTATLTVRLAGTGTGSVSGPGISCGSDCAETFAAGSSVSLTATAGGAAAFSGWSGGGCATANPCTMSITGSVEVTATFTTAAPADLVVSVVGNPPSTAAPGSGFTASDTVVNQGGAAAAGNTTRYYLGVGAQRAAGDVLLLGSRTLASLGAGAASPGTAPVTIPATVAAGIYYLLACADDLGQNAESNETNNCRASAATVQIAAAPPPPPAGGADLVVTEMFNPPASAAAGSTFGARDWVLNQGTATAGASMTRYHLSLDAVRDAGDVLLTGSRSLGSLSPGSTSKGSITVGIPAATPAGLYYLLACADDLGQVGESNEANNCRVSQTRVQVTGGLAVTR